MQVTHIGADRRHEWNAFVAQEPSFALLQSWEWGEFKEKLGWKVCRVAVERHGQIIAGAQVLIHSLPLGVASVAYVPRGPVGDWLDDEITPHLLSALHQVARQHRAVFLRIEPSLCNDSTACQVLQQHSFRASHYTNQPRATIIVDLTPDLDDIFTQMRKKTRQYIRYAFRHGVTVREGTRHDLPALYDLIRITGQRRQFPVRVRDYYMHQWQTFADKGQFVLLMAFYQDHLLAVRTIFTFGKRAAEFQAGSSGEYQHLHPNYLLMWEAIKWTKAHGCDTYDLWGIPDEVGQAEHDGSDAPVRDRSNGLWGVYQFKRGFSKDVVFHTNAHDYVYIWPLYGLLAIAGFKRSKLDRVAVGLDLLRSNSAHVSA
jgi:lipid II:glycine glycyltransferase (peptidoglycan interpeptide bridge formation enzyme)